MPGRRAFLAAVSGGVLVAPAVVGAQPRGRPARIGLLDAGTSNPSSAARWKAFREGLRELGYEEGLNVAFEARWANGDTARLPGLAAELIASKVDIVVTATIDAAIAVRQAATAIPVVMATGGDPVAYGLARSLARPGGNVTGVTSLNNELIGKRLELLKQLVPRISRIAVLREPGNRGSVLAASVAESSGKSLGLAVHTVDLRDRGHVDEALGAAARLRADAVVLSLNTPLIADSRRIAELAVTHRLPLMAPAKEYAEAGALVSYGTDYLDLFRRAAAYVGKILKGARPADLPVEQPTKFELVINLRTAKALGLTIPPAMRLRADLLVD